MAAGGEWASSAFDWPNGGIGRPASPRSLCSKERVDSISTSATIWPSAGTGRQTALKRQRPLGMRFRIPLGSRIFSMQMWRNGSRDRFRPYCSGRSVRVQVSSSVQWSYRIVQRHDHATVKTEVEFLVGSHNNGLTIRKTLINDRRDDVQVFHGTLWFEISK